MKILGRILLVFVPLFVFACGIMLPPIIIQPPVPTVTPSLPPVTTTTTTLATPTPTPTVTPTPTPEPTKTPKPPKPSPCIDPNCDPNKQWTCKPKIEWELVQGNWIRLPQSHPFPGITGDDCNPLKAGCKCLDMNCNRVNCSTGEILAPADDGWFRICVPKPCIDPSPIPTPIPTPTPVPGCPSILEVGGSMLQPRNCAPGCVRDGYLGYVVNWTATELISADTGLCPPGRNRCEMPKACQDPRGAYTWLYLPGVFSLSICDQRSDNFFNCHHKPKKNEVGRTFFISCPFGVEPPVPPASNPLCTIHIVDVRHDKPVEIK